MCVTQTEINVTSVFWDLSLPKKTACNLVKSELHSHIKDKFSVHIVLVSY